ncbi:MAG: oxidoreductase [Candidatus Delongbacteria bacterium]|nr:oxidoreductase [Candidatus Delongbacteria bacterium]MBN2835273.1 oxidoreductase [Candidatus Delongbacteria bacterium]
MIENNEFLVKERVNLLKLTDIYDVFDPQSGTQVAIAKEDPGIFSILLRFIMKKFQLPTNVYVYEGDNYEDSSKLLFSIKRGFVFLRSKVEVLDSNGNLLGWFKSRLLTIGGAFDVFDSSGNIIASLEGDWIGWNFNFINRNGQQIGNVTKKWSGIGKEMFTTADNYMISLSSQDSVERKLLMLAAALAIDIVYKES